MFDLLDQKVRRNRLALTVKAIQKNHSNFFMGVKSVLQEVLSGGDCRSCHENSLLTRISSDCLRDCSLGASGGQHTIVEDEGAAMAIEHLKKNRSGRATFLPWPPLKPRYLAGKNKNWLFLVPVSLMASSLVDYDPSPRVDFPKPLKPWLFWYHWPCQGGCS